ncbi:MAG TPA: glycosyltransferase family 2 protein [Acidimicrobiia bacterium]|nr:glycosyltransferase family 2 protein [Acidimicrobiia bacterium]
MATLSDSYSEGVIDPDPYVFETVGTVSVVIPSMNEGDNLLATVSSIVDNSFYPAFEVVVVDDGSTDGSADEVDHAHRSDPRVRVLKTAGMGVGRARNWGALHARGDVVIFIDAHCYTPPGWMTRLVAPLQNPSVGLVGPALASVTNPGGSKGYGLTWDDPSLLMRWLPASHDVPYPVPLLCGACQAVRRSDFMRVGSFDAGMTRWGSEDHELSLRFWLMGYAVLVQPQVSVYHLFRDHHPYHVDWYGVLFNILRMTLLHLRLDRAQAVLDHYRELTELPSSLHAVLGSDVLVRRAQLSRARVRTDDWWFSEFGVWT